MPQNPDPRNVAVSLRERASRLQQENRQLRQALDAAKLTAEIERRRAEAAREAAARAWRIAGGYR